MMGRGGRVISYFLHIYFIDSLVFYQTSCSWEQFISTIGGWGVTPRTPPSACTTTITTTTITTTTTTTANFTTEWAKQNKKKKTFIYLFLSKKKFNTNKACFPLV